MSPVRRYYVQSVAGTAENGLEGPEAAEFAMVGMFKVGFGVAVSQLLLLDHSPSTFGGTLDNLGAAGNHLGRKQPNTSSLS
jgi:hypothetical protein